MIKGTVLFFTFFIEISVIFSQEIKRRASWEANFVRTNLEVGAQITSIAEGSPLEKAGLKEGDILLSVNDQLIDSPEKWTSVTFAIKGDESTKLIYRRGSNTAIALVKLNPLGIEKHQELDTYYESIVSDYGLRQRTIVTKPKGTSERMPAIMLIQGLSCSTIEKYSGRGGNWVNQINYIVENSGMVVMLVDKPGVGDSEGDCSETDFITELSGYRAAIRSLKSKKYVDTTRIVIYGASMGSALAPLLVNEFNLAGIISDGTFFKTWYEHMLEIERRIREMEGDDQSTIAKKMNEGYIPLYYGMLIEKQSYAEVIKKHPALKDYNYHAPRHMYGRPVEYYHQLQDMDLAGEWSQVKVPVRILYGSNDWIMSEFDNHMIIDELERVGHKDHELLIYPGLDHWNTIHKKPSDSYFFRKGEWDPAVPEIVLSWINDMIKE
ncbi:MAG: alpha/beta hydrolase [Bacteroidota bacterium]